MKIRNEPIFDTAKVIEHYTKKDGVDIKYVCTSAPNAFATFAADIFYRETPHPEFGNRYFGLFLRDVDTIVITNADPIEDLDFAMIKDGDEYVYSQHRHDFKGLVNGSFIDGGRSYYRLGGDPIPEVVVFRVKDGEFVSAEDDNNTEA